MLDYLHNNASVSLDILAIVLNVTYMIVTWMRILSLQHLLNEVMYQQHQLALLNTTAAATDNLNARLKELQQAKFSYMGRNTER